MSEEINNNVKLSKLLEEKQYSEVLKEIKYTSDSLHSFNPLILVELYCKICINQLRSARILVNKELKKNPKHELLLAVDNHLTNLKMNNHSMNPLTAFIQSFIEFNTNTIVHSSSTDFEKLMHQILVKPYIK